MNFVGLKNLNFNAKKYDCFLRENSNQKYSKISDYFYDFFNFWWTPKTLNFNAKNYDDKLTVVLFIKNNG